ncbi:glutamate dehydrogenase [Sphingorhabdus lutea]|uniref:Glutamate dehydrogenase n=1 Tax=Sphingorhabdus lutea TaxID=1913578 RepID=A0A1L3JDQ5_9SPHN|nr:NAD-glutamate dehydrogenase domain-containing protein [Sphingorhabdus lutea]APG63278.1 glutamate dehydrogenase [Sphingorhabdus lutea]
MSQKIVEQDINKDLLSQTIASFLDHALPGENDGFDENSAKEAALFALNLGLVRDDNRPLVAVETFTNNAGRLALRIAIINDDMPFIVDSVSAALGNAGLEIERLIHPVLHLVRDNDGRLSSIAGTRADLGKTMEGHSRESVIYIEADRVDAAKRQNLKIILEQVLGDVRGAVGDWPNMVDILRADAKNIRDSEAAALINWFADGQMTILAHEIVDNKGKVSAKKGIAHSIDGSILSLPSVNLALKHLAQNPKTDLLVLKSNRSSTVHRSALLDLLVVANRNAKGDVQSLSITAGLWTSAALAEVPEDVPILRQRQSELLNKFGFDPQGHAGKALTHSLTSLPHDLLVSLKPEDLERITLSAMSLSDRPRPKLIAVRSPLGRHLSVFVWLQRDDVSTNMRRIIGDMVCEAAQAKLLSWTIGLEEGGLALLRYTLDLPDRSIRVDEDALDAKLRLMVRGWEPAVEGYLAEQSDAKRAAAIVSRFGPMVPVEYRTRHGIEQSAEDLLRMVQMEREGKKNVRIYLREGDDENRLRLKIYNLDGSLHLSDAVPALENFGFSVVEETPTELVSQNDEGEKKSFGYIHDFLLGTNQVASQDLAARAEILEQAIVDVLEGAAEDDRFNKLITVAGLEPQAVIWFRAWFRYLRQAGLSYGLLTFVDALNKVPHIAAALAHLFTLRHDPNWSGDREVESKAICKKIQSDLAQVSAIDDDRIIRLLNSLILAVLRTNAFAPSAQQALAFKIDSSKIPILPKPLPWREVWVYSPRVEGIHLRAGPVARGGLRWSDRRDDFRTEVLGLMKAQRVKNAVIVPTGAKGGFYPKMLPNMADDRDKWFEEGKESYRIFIRSLLSLTDNIVDDKIVHPDAIVRHDADDPYFVVAADKGTATFSDVANALAAERGFWLGDAFASGGSYGYDHKAMGITAKGAWVSVQRHFLEMGMDVQKDESRVIGIGDMSGDVFGNGMLLSKAIKLVAAFDHRHIFIDPNPDAAAAWKERKRMFDLPRSSWEDYDPKLISKGGGIFPRSAKSIKLTPEIRNMLNIEEKEIEPSALMTLLLKAPVDLLWMGGIGTYIKARSENHVEVGDPSNDAIRVNAEDIQAKIIGEGANLGVTQAARISYALKGGRINTDFIDNSAGVDCSDNEVNIKIPINRLMVAGDLAEAKRNKLLVDMTDAVSELVLDDNRAQALALSIAQADGAEAMASYLRLIERFEGEGRLDRQVEGIAANDDLQRRSAEGFGLMRPELAVILSTSKIALQDAIEGIDVADDAAMDSELLAAFPPMLVKAHKDALLSHRLRTEIVATKIANRIINRMGMLHPFELAEEEGAPLAEVAKAYIIIERLFNLTAIFDDITTAKVDEETRLALYTRLAKATRLHMADLMRTDLLHRPIGEILEILSGQISKLQQNVDDILTQDARIEAEQSIISLQQSGAPTKLVQILLGLEKVDGAIGIVNLALNRELTPEDVAQAFVKIGDMLGLGWAQRMAVQMQPSDPWEKLLVAGIARDLQQMRLDFLNRSRGDMDGFIERWGDMHLARIQQFKHLVTQARQGGMLSLAMLAQIAGQARVLLNR